jgi:hypothetical protein
LPGQLFAFSPRETNFIKLARYEGVFRENSASLDHHFVGFDQRRCRPEKSLRAPPGQPDRYRRVFDPSAGMDLRKYLSFEFSGLNSGD